MGTRQNPSKNSSMGKWIERVTLAVIFAVVAVVLIGIYATHQDCISSRGTTVRGLFWLVCIR